MFSRSVHRTATPTGGPHSSCCDECGGVLGFARLQAVDENTRPPSRMCSRRQAFSCVNGHEVNGGSWMPALSSGFLISLLIVATGTTAGMLGSCPLDVCWHELTICTAPVPYLLGARFVMHVCCSTSRLMVCAFVEQHAYRMRV